METKLYQTAKEFFKYLNNYEADIWIRGSRAYDVNGELIAEYNAETQALNIPVVSGSILLPDGWKVYKCTDCQEINVKKDNRQIMVGLCDSCKHPLWNDDVD